MAKNYYTIDSSDVLFTKCDGVTTTFVDSSTANPKTITANGNATQLPIKFNKSAGFFNGTTDYVVVPDSADWDFGTGDYNYEVFFNMTTVQTCYIVNFDALSFGFRYASGHFYVYEEGAARIDYTWTPTANTWYHVRARRTGGTTTLYVDGSSQGTPYTAAAQNITGTGLTIGREEGGSAYFAGWLKELRIIKGTSTTITVPTVEYTATSEANTVLLMHFDTPATSPLGPAIYFDGTGDGLVIAHSDSWAMSANETIEFFVNFSSVAADRPFVGQLKSTPSNADIWGFYWDTSNVLRFFQRVGGTNDIVLDWAFTPTTNKWYAIALVKDGNDYEIFVNGVSLGTLTDTSAVVDLDGSLNLFRCRDEAYNLPIMDGYIRDFHWHKTSKYTSAYTPSQNGFTVDANTVLYIKGNEDNGVTTFVDSETTPKTVTTAGDTKVKYVEDYRSCVFVDETGKFPYPVGSAKVDFFAIGSGVYYGTDAGNGYLSIAASDDWKLGTGNFTAEIYFRNDASFGNLIDCSVYGAGGWGIQAIAATTIAINLGGSSQNAWIDITVPTMITQTWYHVAMSRVSGVTNTFLNGTLIDSRADTYNYQPARALQIGGFYYTYNGEQNNQWTGRLDNIRISKGVARYTASFNPPEFRAFIPRAIMF